MFIERILDLFAIVTLGLAAGFVSFRSGLPADVQIVFAIGVVVRRSLLAGGLLTMRNFGRRILTRLPLPHRVIEFYDRFEEGVFASIGLRALPRLVILTGLIWATEAMRLYLVVQALGLPDVHLGISGAFFVALSASLLTAVPLTPAGIGFVEGGVVGLLTIVYGVVAEPTPSRSRSSTGRSASSRSSSSGRSSTRSRRSGAGCGVAARRSPPSVGQRSRRPRRSGVRATAASSRTARSRTAPDTSPSVDPNRSPSGRIGPVRTGDMG